MANTTALMLHCLVIGQPISDAFTVNIARNGTVSTLKGVIKGNVKNESIFEHIPAHRLVLWSVSLPADESLNNAFEGLREEDALVSPFLKLSTIFASPIKDHVHVAVAPPLGLNCFILGSPSNDVFTVNIAKDSSVAALKEIVKEKNKPKFNHIPAHCLVLWKVSVPINQNLPKTVERLDLKNDSALLPLIRWSEVFTKRPNSTDLHIVVKDPSLPSINQVRVQPIGEEGHDGTLKSWDQAFIGDTHRIFYENATKRCEGPEPYARYQLIIQSSGMGKSRMVDELSKGHFVIPVNLRTSGTGFPPGDEAVPGFLIRQPFDQNDAYIRSHAFLTSLFTVTYTILQEIEGKLENTNITEGNRYKTLTENFREHMRFGQTFKKHGQHRVQFYEKVIRLANELMKGKVNFGSATTEPSEEESTSSPSKAISFGNDSSTESMELRGAIKKLLEYLNPNLPTVDTGLGKVPIMLFLAFDEAHSLAFPTTNIQLEGQAPPTTFSEMRRTLRRMTDFPVFSVFLSTTGNIKDFNPPPHADPSGRVFAKRLHLIPPFIELGFDQMLKADGLEINNGRWQIDEVSTVGFMARFGRPLFGSRHKYASDEDQAHTLNFAAAKLCGGCPATWKYIDQTPGAQLALIAVRLALEFSAVSTASRNRELEQVEKYMRVCMRIDKDFETVVTTSPSEPILAEASRLVMLDNPAFNVPRALLKQLEKPGLDKGDRGELVAELLLILASDAAYDSKKNSWTSDASSKTRSKLKLEKEPTVPRAVTLESFLKNLLKEEWQKSVFASKPTHWRTKVDQQRTFKTTFRDSKVYFNHFIKIDDDRVINREFLWRLVARGAAVLCANGQGGVDIVIPFVYRGGVLSRQNISAIFIQVKNNANFGLKPNVLLFDLMNPFLLRFYDVDEKDQLPVIRMVFALASRKASLTVMAPMPERPMRQAKTKDRKSPRYTAYDIWCARASSDTFGVISTGDDNTFESLLKLCKVFPDAYTSDIDLCVVEEVRRSMNPGTAVDPKHWGFCSDVTKFEEIREDPADDVDFNYGEESDGE